MALLLLAACGLAALPWTLAQNAVGDSVCIEGFIMDIFCIERGTLLDNPSVRSLEGPERHSVHCLVDVSACTSSGYEVLLEPEDGAVEYCRAFRLDDDGNSLIIGSARRLGSVDKGCTTCSGEGDLGEGYRATVTGTVTVAGTNTTPAVITVTDVQDSSVGCPNGNSKPAFCVREAGSAERTIVFHGFLMVLSWGIILPAGVIVALLFRHRPGGTWFLIHSAAQVSGLILAIVGFGVALFSFSVFGDPGSAPFAHGCMGVTVMVVGLLQPINACFRPHLPQEGEKKSAARRVWEVVHKGLGYSVVLLAVATIGLGTTLVPEEADQRKFQIGYAVSAGLVLAGLAGVLAYDKYVGYKPVPSPVEGTARTW